MSNREAVRKLLALLKDYTKIISIIFGCLLISTVLNLCVPLLSRRIMDDGFIGGNKELLIKLVLCSLMVYLVISVIDIIKEKNRINISAKIQYSLSEQAFSHLMKMKASYFNNKNYAEILNNINEITLTNLENGEVTLEQLNEIYNKMGFVFVANKGRFTKIRKEIKH